MRTITTSSLGIAFAALLAACSKPPAPTLVTPAVEANASTQPAPPAAPSRTVAATDADRANTQIEEANMDTTAALQSQQIEQLPIALASAPAVVVEVSSAPHGGINIRPREDYEVDKTGTNNSPATIPAGSLVAPPAAAIDLQRSKQMRAVLERKR